MELYKYKFLNVLPLRRLLEFSSRAVNATELSKQQQTVYLAPIFVRCSTKKNNSIIIVEENEMNVNVEDIFEMDVGQLRNALQQYKKHLAMDKEYVP